MIRKHKANLNLDLSNFPYLPKIITELSRTELPPPKSRYHAMFFPFILKGINYKMLAQKHYQQTKPKKIISPKRYS